MRADVRAADEELEWKDPHPHLGSKTSIIYVVLNRTVCIKPCGQDGLIKTGRRSHRVEMVETPKKGDGQNKKKQPHAWLSMVWT